VQDHLGRAEGYNIVHADRQFIVPTDGKPIRGLIQDHVVAGVELTCRCKIGSGQICASEADNRLIPELVHA
jgi:DNA-directed RNA polymerase beta' subunit